MSSLARLDLTLIQGKRFKRVFRWGQPVKAYVAIAAVPQKTPLRLQTNDPHGLTEGWPFRVTGVKGMTPINERTFKAKVVDANTVEVNAVNAADFPDYASGGHIEYFLPVDLTGFTGRANFKGSTADANAALEITTANGRMILDNAARTITFDVGDGVTAAMGVTAAGIWDWEMVSGSGVVETPIPEKYVQLHGLPRWKLVKEAAK